MPALPEINFRRTPVSLILTALAAALEVICTVSDLQGGERRVDYYNEYLGILPRIWAGQLWRPFTTTLLHGGLIHAAFNIYWLLIFGATIENRIGPHRTLGLIVLLGYVSMMPEYVIGSFHRENPIMIVGLSGIVYGLFGILWIGRRWRSEFREVCNDQTAQILLGWFVLCIVLTAMDAMNVANIAHGAGFLFGVLYGTVAFAPQHRRRWIALAVLASVLVLSSLIACPGHAGYEYVKRGGRLWWNPKPPARILIVD